MFWCWKGTLYHCIRRGVPLSNSARSLQRLESGKIKLLNHSHCVVVTLTIHEEQQKMNQGTFLGIGRLILYGEGFWGERVIACWEIGRWTKYMSLVHSFCVEGYPKSQQILMVPCLFLILPCMAFCGAAWWGLQLQWFGVHAVQCVAGGNCQKDFQAYCSLGQGQMKADIASVINLLMQQPRALQKHARLVRMQKRIVGQRTAVGTHCTMLNHVEDAECIGNLKTKDSGIFNGYSGQVWWTNE